MAELDAARWWCRHARCTMGSLARMLRKTWRERWDRIMARALCTGHDIHQQQEADHTRRKRGLSVRLLSDRSGDTKYPGHTKVNVKTMASELSGVSVVRSSRGRHGLRHYSERDPPLHPSYMQYIHTRSHHKPDLSFAQTSTCRSRQRSGASLSNPNPSATIVDALSQHPPPAPPSRPPPP